MNRHDISDEQWETISPYLKIKRNDPKSISIDASYVKLYQHGTGVKGSTSHKRSGEVKAD
jgi:hypothetical protein